MKNRNNGSRIFLTELMFSILFFIVIAAVCVQCFAQSFIMSKDAEVLTQAVNAATNEAEIFVNNESPDSFTNYYDDNWQKSGEDGTYKLTGIVTEENGLINLKITVATLDDDTEIYSLNVEKAL